MSESACVRGRKREQEEAEGAVLRAADGGKVKRTHVSDGVLRLGRERKGLSHFNIRRRSRSTVSVLLPCLLELFSFNDSLFQRLVSCSRETGRMRV